MNGSLALFRNFFASLATLCFNFGLTDSNFAALGGGRTAGGLRGGASGCFCASGVPFIMILVSDFRVGTGSAAGTVPERASPCDLGLWDLLGSGRSA